MRSLLACLCIAVPAAGEPRTDVQGDPLPEGALARFGTIRYRVAARGPYALSPDGKTLAVESRTATTLWDVDTGRPRIRIPFGSFPIFGSVPGLIAWSPDGKYLVTVLFRDVRIWDAATGQQRIGINLSFDARKVAFFPNSNHFAVTENQTRNLGVFDVVTGRQVKAPDPEAEIDVLSRSGRYFLGTAIGVRHMVDAQTGKLRCKLTETSGHPELPMEMSPDDHFVYALSDRGYLRTFDAETGTKLEDLSGPIGSPDFPSGERLALSPGGDVVYLWGWGPPTHRRDLKAGKWLDPLPAMPSGRLIPHPDGRRVLFLGDDGLLRRYDLAALKEIPPPAGFDSEISATARPDGRWVVVQSTPRESYIRPRIDMFNPIGQLAWSMQSERGGHPSWGPEGRLFVAGLRGMEYRDPATGKRDRKFPVPDVELSPSREGVMFAADEKRFVAPRSDCVLGVFDTATGKQLGGGKPDESGGTMSLSPDGRTVALGSQIQGVCYIDTATGKVRVPWTDPAPPCTTPYVLFSPDASYLLHWDVHGVAIVRDPVTARRMRTFKTGYDVEAFAISPDGLWLAIGTKDGTVALWDVATGTQVWARCGHASEVNRVSFAGPGRLVTSSVDLTALLWDLTSDRKPTKPLWEALSGNDAKDAYQAVCALSADPGGPELLRRKIEPAKPVRTDDVKRWIADLGANRFAVREAATKSLRDLGRPIEPELRTARAAAMSAEVRSRLDMLLADLPPERTAGEVIHARAIAAMELAGTDAAKKLLAEWAAGSPGARLTADAKAALTRLNATSH